VKATAQDRGASASGPSRWSGLKQFFRESVLELRKVIWPTREEVMKLTGFVVLVVIIVGLFMYIWGEFIGVITNRVFLGR
jgi:preprotein translocase SecE subunit